MSYNRPKILTRLALLLSLIVLVRCSPSIPGFLDDPSIIHVFVNQGSRLGSAMLGFTLNGTASLELSVYFDLNKDNQFSENEKGIDAQPVLVVERTSILLPIVFEDDLQMDVLLNPREQSLRVQIIARESTSALVLHSQTITAFMMEWNTGEVISFEPGFAGGMGEITHRALISTGSSPPSIPLNQSSDFRIYNQDVPDLLPRKGKRNECVPLATANALLLLSQRHNFRNLMPASDDALIDELEKDFGWSNKGVPTERILQGKNAFTTRRNLPLINKRIDANYGDGRNDLWDKIVAELQAGEAVELLIEFKETPTSQNVKGSHFATVAGVQRHKGQQYVLLHDPATPAGTESYKILNNGLVQGYPLGKAYLVLIISQSFDPNLPKPPQTQTASPTVSVTMTASPSATLTPTPSQTSTPTFTPTRTATRTPTPTGTATSTPSLTTTRTVTLTNLPPTLTRTASTTSTLFLATPSRTSTPTLSPTPIRTVNSTGTLTPGSTTP